MDARTGRSRVGADIGGTFTDLVLLREDGRILRQKVPSTVDDYARGIITALRAALREQGDGPEQIREIVHGTTVATNAILELKGARCGLITTRGFRDVLEIRRLRMPQLYRLDWPKPPVLIERHLRREVNERIASDGTVLVPLDPAEVVELGRWFVAQEVEALAVAFLNSYVNPDHELAAGRVLREAFPSLPVSLSAEILPEIQEYERTSTSVVNAYVQPRVRSYLQSLRRTLDAENVSAPLLIMQSNGGLMSSRAAGERPVRIIESGPAAGVIACREIALECGYPNVISFDMGGTTAKASVIEDGRLQQSAEYEVGGGVSIGSRMSRGGGYVVRIPSIDIAEVGAGGGSLVSFDKAGGMQVGPASAGAFPGPVCYRNGNEQPTVTDANVALGYISPEGLAGGTLRIDAAAARRAVEQKVALPLGGSVHDAAFGIHTIANASMIRALRSVTVERGRDPSDFALCAFGGNGPVHAAHLARAMEIGTILVPPCPGLFSAFGLLLADVEHHYSRTIRRPLRSVGAADLESSFRDLAAQAEAGAADPEYPLPEYRLHRSLVLRFVGQTMGLPVNVPEGLLTAGTLDAVVAVFRQDYERTYGFQPPGEIEVDSMRLVARAGTMASSTWLESAAHAEADVEVAGRPRLAHFGPRFGSVETPVLSRAQLGRDERPGPLIVEGYDATTVVPPDCTAALDAFNNIVIRVPVQGRP
jgi:N-methylhydantoinase A